MLKSRRNFLKLLAGIFAFITTFAPLTVQAAVKKVKYVFYLIGDGMGDAQRTAAEAFKGEKLTMNKLEAQGLATTYAANRFITGSAAAVTALMTGHKTDIGMINLTPEGKPLKTIAEMAKESGMKVGVITSTSLDHATPAGCYAHVPKRNMYYDIAIQLANSGFDFFGGGGFKDPENKKKNSKHYVGNVYDYMKSKGYRIIRSKYEFMNLKNGDEKIIVINPRLQPGASLPYTIDQTEEDITLPELLSKAIEVLDNPNGFFIMLEGGKIDWACHDNDAATALRETVAFDDAVKVAYDFYKKHPDETLIVVTGDHETGGMSLGYAATKYETNFPILYLQKMSYQEFKDKVAKKLKKKGYVSFEEVKPLITKYFGLKFKGDKKDPLVLKPYEVAQLKLALEDMLKGYNGKKDPYKYVLYGKKDPLTITAIHILDHHAGIGWTSFKHTASAIPTSAQGAYAHLFDGYYDNTDIAKKIMKALGYEPKVYYLNNYYSYAQ